jgi:hypothetical protein
VQSRIRSRILFLPEFSSIASFNDVLARGAFHVAHIKPEALAFVVDKGMEDQAGQATRAVEIHPGLDPDIESQIRRVQDRVSVIDSGSIEAERIGDLSDIVAVWDRAVSTPMSGV